MNSHEIKAENEKAFELGSDDLTNGLCFSDNHWNHTNHINFWYDEPLIA